MARFNQKRNGILGLLCLLLAPVMPVWAVTAGDILKSTGTRAPGLCVIVGCRDGELAAGLAREGMLVHGLAPDQEAVEKLRRDLVAQKIYGQVSVEMLDSSSLPYAPNLVNLLIAEELSTVLQKGPSIEEIMRVIAPLGTVMVSGISEKELKKRLEAAGMAETAVARKGQWLRMVKPRPTDMDEWTHQRHGPDGNPVSCDEVGPPTGIRWVAGPTWPFGARKLDISAMVSANGRNFHITYNEASNLDVAPHMVKPHIVARDAYNGLLLWTRPWKGPLAADGDGKVPQPWSKPFIPNQEGRKPFPLAAEGDRVYTAVKKTVELESELFGWEEDKVTWSIKIPNPLQVESMVLAGDTLCVAGKSDRFLREESGFLWILSAKDGTRLFEKRLESAPVSEGLAVAYGRLFVSTQDRKLLCFGKW